MAYHADSPENLQRCLKKNEIQRELQYPTDSVSAQSVEFKCGIIRFHQFGAKRPHQKSGYVQSTLEINLAVGASEALALDGIILSLVRRAVFLFTTYIEPFPPLSLDEKTHLIKGKKIVLSFTH